MPDYQKAKIYKLWSPHGTDEEVYYGSTCNDLRYRKNQHKQKDCSSKILFEKYDDVRIELVEDYPCNNKAELNKKEGHYIRENKCLNKKIPDRTKKEYQRQYVLNNREKINEQSREYNLKNKEKINEQSRERYRKKKEEALISL